MRKSRTIPLTQRDAKSLLTAVYRAIDWTDAVLAGLVGATDPADLRYAECERRAKGRYRSLQRRLERKLRLTPL